MAFMDQFLGDFFLNKKEAPADAIPGTFCHFPTFIIYPLCEKIIDFMLSNDLSISIWIFDQLYPKQQDMLLDYWNDLKEYQELKAMK